MSNHITNNHDDDDDHTLITNLHTSTNLEQENFSMAMEDHHHHNPLIPLFHQQVAWPNYLHNNHITSLLPSSSTLLCMRPTTLQSTKENNSLQGEKEEEEELEEEELGAMKEMMYRYAVMQPVDIDPATIHKPKRRNVRISNDPQSVAARHRRERISEKIRILQRLVPGGTKMDTASMLDEAIRYVKFLKKQIRQLQQKSSSSNHTPPPVPLAVWPIFSSTTTSIVGPTSENSTGPREVVGVEHFHHQGLNTHN